MQVYRRINISVAILFFILINALGILKIQGSYEPEVLLPILNIVFIGILPIFVAYYYASIYTEDHYVGAALLFCGLLTYGIGSILAGLFRDSIDGANKTVTLHNLACLLSSIFHFVSSMIDESKQFNKSKRNIKLHVVLFTVAILVLFALIIDGLYRQWMPRFVYKNGYSSLRQFVLWFSVIFYFSSASVILKKYQKQKDSYFLFWYAMMLIMIAIGIYGVINSPTVGGYIGWMGRLSQYYGGFLGFYSAFYLKKYYRKQVDIKSALSGFFKKDQDKQAVQFEHFISLLSQSFINTAVEKLNESILQAMKIVAEYFDSDKVVVYSYCWDKNLANHVMEWNRKPEYYTGDVLRTLELSDFELVTEKHHKGQVYVRNSLDELSKNSQFYRLIEATEAFSVCSYPMMEDGQTIGMISIATIGRNKIWTENEISNIKVFSDILTNVYLRKCAQDALIKSEQNALLLIQDLKKADEDKNEYINILSHELRNPVAAITAGISILDLTEDKELWQSTKEMIKRQSSQLSSLVDNLLDITRINNNKIKLNTKLLDLNDLIYLITEDYRLLYDNKSVNLRVEFGTNCLMFEADPVRFTQAIGNLLHNSLKFNDQGGETIVSTAIEENIAIIQILDTGIGIEGDTLPRLFQPFIQADRSLDRSKGGLGLGLAISKGIIELHGGTIGIHSEGIGKGTRIQICLPL